ncbi:Vomp family autotransporter [Bartonella sp. 220]|uniref:Vomp family autotransporter n=1 Tax=Bartonella sp. 220B TaxID=2967260 RepID=UPI0022A9EA35|nr:Vomp family autotransporter [Bartonella sp. 220B]MCZ2157680.1 Vomp family autotransporter [Bartonella sp. 220B]
MKKYSTPNSIKAVSLGAVIATLLSSVSPVIAANLAITGGAVLSTSGAGVSYSKGSHGSIVLAGDDDYCGVFNVIGRGGKNQGTVNQMTAEELYEGVSLNKDFSGKKPFDQGDRQIVWVSDATTNSGGYMGRATGGLLNAMPEAFGVYSFATGCGSSAMGNYSTAFGAGATTKRGGAQAFGLFALAGGQASLAIGVASETGEKGAIAIGGLAKATGTESIAFGNKSRADKQDAIAVGFDARATVEGGVALGSESVADAFAGVRGYSPLKNGVSENEDYGWKSTLAAVSVGNPKEKLTRQITGVAAGSNDTDAVNVAQLKELQSYIGQDWQLSVGGKNATTVGATSVVDLSAASNNLTVTKGAEDNNVKFDLAKNITVERVTAGRSSISDDGIMFADGARITVDGIYAGDKQITGVAEGTEDTDAVNFAQLNAVKEAAKTSWQLSVNSGDAIAIGQNGTVNLQAAGSENKQNIKIVRDDNHNVTFDLADDIHVTSVTAGRSVMNDQGFHFEKGGPEVTPDGIDAGNKRIIGLEKGQQNTDAVNVAQLKEMESQIAENSLVKWDDEQERITIGAEKGGVEINVANNDGDDRKISGVKAAVNANDAVNKQQLDGQIADVIDTIKSNNLVKREEERNRITIGKEIEGTEIHIANKSGEARAISGVKAATKDDEAVNKQQLDGEIADITDRIQVIKEANKFAVLYDKNGDNSVNYKSITLGGDKTKEPVALHNVKDGEITEESGDAINGSQINKISGDIAEFFGGDAAFQDGAFVGPRYNLSTVSEDGSVKQKIFKDVGSALTGLDANVKNVNSHLDHVVNEFTQKIDGVSKDSLLWSEQERAFVALHGPNGEKTNSKIKFLKDGEISSDSTDAVNGSQIFKIAKNISNYFGGSTDVEAGIKPTFLIKDTQYDNVTDAFTGVNISIANLDGKISEMKKDNLVQQEGGASGIITIGKATAGTEINIAGVGGVARTISGVKTAEKGDEAVNKDQLDKSIEKISKNIETASAAAVLYDKENGVVDYNRVTLGGKNSVGPVALLNVKDGRIADGSTDAITGNQLYHMSNQLAAYFGGGASYQDGQWTAPNFKVAQLNADGTTEEKSYGNVADALSGVSSNMVSINDRIDHVIDKVDSDALKWNDLKGAYDAKHEGKPSKIINVADGNIVENSKDAVNGGQLWKTNERVAGVEKDIKHITNRVDNISNTIGDIGNTVTNIENRVDNIENTVNNLADGAVHYDKTEDGKKTNKITLKGGDASEPVLIDNVADGRIEKGSKEAVNGGQLHDYTEQQMKIILDESKHYTDQRVNNIVIDAVDDAVDRANQYTDMKFNILSYDIKSVRKEARQAAAVGLAVSNLRYFDDPGSLSVSFGSGAWRGQSAFALGAGYTSENGKIRSNLSATSAGGHWGVGGAITLKIK